ncbi:MAG: GntR family transcriptional regulator [Alphaproteobacteria bacterium]
MSDLNGLRRLERDSLRDRVYEEIRAGIFAGRFAPGERVTIRALAAALGVSPTPVREALNRLIAEGAFAPLANGSVAVPELDAGRFAELLEMRLALEGLAAARAAGRIAPAELAALDALLAELSGLAGRRAWAAYLDRHRDFHFRVYAAAGMPLLTATVEGLWMRCGPALGFVVPDYVARKRGATHHAALVDALRRGDAEGARAAVIADIGEAGAYIASLAGADGTIRHPRPERRSA